MLSHISWKLQGLYTDVLTAALHFLTKGWEKGFRTEIISKPSSYNLSSYRIGPVKRKN